MSINRAKLVSYLKEVNGTTRNFHISTRYLEQQNVKLYPVVNGEQMRNFGISSSEDISGVYGMYQREADKLFLEKFGQTSEQFMKDREYSQEMFIESSNSIKKLIELDKQWKIKKQKTNITLKELKALGKKNQITEELVLNAYSELEELTKIMNQFLDAMSKIDAGYGVSQKGTFEPTAGVPISITGAAKTSMDRAEDYAKQFTSVIQNRTASLKRLNDYAKKSAVRTIAPMKLVNSKGKTSQKSIKGGGGDRVIDIMSSFEGYVSSIKGSVFEGLVLKSLSDGASLTEEIVREGLTGDAKGTKITEKFTKNTATTDVKIKDSKISNKTINVSVKNQPSGSLSSGKTVKTSFLTTGLNNVIELITDRSVDTSTALRIMFAQDKNKPAQGSSELNKMVSATMLDYAIASASTDRIDLVAYQEGVLPYPAFLKKVIGKNGITMDARVKKSNVYDAQKYIGDVLNRKSTSDFMYNPTLGFVFRH